MFELFVLGHGNYAEEDVRQAARTFTGWRWTPAGGFRVAARLHDDGTKTVLGHTGNLGGEDVIRLAASQPASHRWIASRIWSRFGAHAAPTDPAVTALLADAPPKPLSALFRAVLLSPALTTPSVRGGSAEAAGRVGGRRAAGTGHDAAGQQGAADIEQSWVSCRSRPPPSEGGRKARPGCPPRPPKPA